MHFLKTLIGALLIGALVTPPVFAQQAPVREITQIKGNLYRFRNNFHYSVFVVTPAGIIATDPINAEAARWLKAELAKRFNLPVKYLLYSHDHADHISGGEVFADTAVVVSHDNAKRTIVGERRPTAVPQVTFSDNLTIELGGTVVELSHVGRNHSDNSVVMRFPAERVLFAVDFIPVNELPFRDFPDGWMPDWIDSLKRVEAMDFDVLAPGHGPVRRAPLRAPDAAGGAPLRLRHPRGGRARPRPRVARQQDERRRGARVSRGTARRSDAPCARRQVARRDQAGGQDGKIRILGQLQELPATQHRGHVPAGQPARQLNRRKPPARARAVICRSW